MTVTDDSGVELKFTSIENIYHVAAVLGAPSPWFDETEPVVMLDRIYPAERGAYVVEHTPPLRAHMIKLTGTQRLRDQGSFRVLWIGMDGTVEAVSEKVYQSRRGALYAAEKRAEDTGHKEQS